MLAQLGNNAFVVPLTEPSPPTKGAYDHIKGTCDSDCLYCKMERN